MFYTYRPYRLPLTKYTGPLRLENPEIQVRKQQTPVWGQFRTWQQYRTYDFRVLIWIIYLIYDCDHTSRDYLSTWDSSRVSVETSGVLSGKSPAARYSDNVLCINISLSFQVTAFVQMYSVKLQDVNATCKFTLNAYIYIYIYITSWKLTLNSWQYIKLKERIVKRSNINTAGPPSWRPPSSSRWPWCRSRPPSCRASSDPKQLSGDPKRGIWNKIDVLLSDLEAT